jgi:hypothetical protein
MSQQENLNQELINYQKSQTDLLAKILGKLFKAKNSMAQVARKSPSQQQQKGNSGKQPVSKGKNKLAQVFKLLFLPLRLGAKVLMAIPNMAIAGMAYLMAHSQQTPLASAKENGLLNAPSQEQLLYGMKDGKPFMSMNGQDAKAISDLMRSRQGQQIAIANGQDLLIKSPQGQVLFETDSEGKVVFNIYEKNPLLINDKSFKQSSGLSALESAVAYVQQSEQIAEASKKVNQTLERVEKSVPAIPLESQQAQQINRQRAIGTPKANDRNAQILSVCNNLIQSQSGKEFGSILLQPDLGIEKLRMGEGFAIRLNGKDFSALIGSYQPDVGWTFNPVVEQFGVKAGLEKCLVDRGLLPKQTNSLSLSEQEQKGQTQNNLKAQIANDWSTPPQAESQPLAQGNSKAQPELSRENASVLSATPQLVATPEPEIAAGKTNTRSRVEMSV